MKKRGKNKEKHDKNQYNVRKQSSKKSKTSYQKKLAFFISLLVVLIISLCALLIYQYSERTIPKLTPETLPNPISLWHFDESDYETGIKDTYGKYNGTSIGNVRSIAGPIGRFAEFNTSNHIYINITPDLLLSTPKTISLWVKPYEFSQLQNLFNGKNDDHFFNISLVQNKTLFSFGYAPYGYPTLDSILSTKELNLNNWSNIIIVYNLSVSRGSTKLYIDGELQGSKTFINNANYILEYIELGASFNGSLDELSMYEGILTETQIQDIYLSQKIYIEGINPPSNIIAIPISSTKINISWADNSNNEEGFRVWKSNNGQTAWVSSEDLPVETNSYIWEDLVENTSYYFKVEAYNGDVSSNSDTINTKTKEHTCDWDGTGCYDNEMLVNVSITAGISYIAFPLKPLNNNLSEFILNLNNLKGNIRIWYNGNDRQIYPLDEIGYPALLSQEYQSALVISSEEQINLTFDGYEYEEEVILNLTKGENLISIPYCSNSHVYNASNILLELNNTNKKSCPTIIEPNNTDDTAHWYSINESFNSISPTSQKLDFTIDNKKGYILICDNLLSETYLWTPLCKDYSPCTPTWISLNTSCNSTGKLITYQRQNGTSCLNAIPSISNYTQDCVYCEANWTSYLTSCSQGDIRTRYYLQNRTFCNETKVNETLRCDYNNNNILGVESDIDSSRTLSLYINDQRFNDTKIYNSSNAQIELREGGINRVEFTFSPNSTNILNITFISIELSSSSSNYGYIVIDGIDKEKTVRLDKKNSNSNSVCILNKSSVDEDSFSSRCTSSDEYKISCDGEDEDGFTCDVENSGNKSYFVVQGLKHSAIREILPSTSTTSSGTNTGTGTNSRTGTNTNTNNTSGNNQQNNQNGQNNAGNSNNDTEDTKQDDIVIWVIIGAIALSIIITIAIIIAMIKKNLAQDEFQKPSPRINPPTLPQNQMKPSPYRPSPPNNRTQF